MGLFSRKDSAPSRKPLSKPRPSVSSEAQAADLRARARRRLAGSIALILAAVVVLPMLLDSEPTPVSGNIPIRIPDRQAPFQPNLSEPEVASAQPAAAPITAQTAEAGEGSSTASAVAAAAGATASSSAGAIPKPEPAPKPSAGPPPEPPKPPAAPRRDDAARALALLEGRTPVASAPTPKAPVRGNFVVQAMSLDSAADAQKQRNVLAAAGLNNAFVDGPVTVNGRPKYRVRVGPFQSREAAQAAQTRLRTLGYGGAFITTQ